MTGKGVNYHPISSDHQLDAYIQVVDELLDKKTLTPQEDKALTSLSQLIHDYESRKYPVKSLSPGRLLLSLVRLRGISMHKVARLLSTSLSKITQIVDEEIEMSQHQKNLLGDFFGINPNAFTLKKRVFFTKDVGLAFVVSSETPAEAYNIERPNWEAVRRLSYQVAQSSNIEYEVESSYTASH